jgi:hypothetical protein
MPDQIYLVKWRSGTFSLLFSAEHGLFDALDKFGTPSEAEVRIVPPELMREVTFDQKQATGHFEISVEVEHMLWRVSRSSTCSGASASSRFGPWRHSAHEKKTAEQVARANDRDCHAACYRCIQFSGTSCWRMRRASPGRGSSLTFGKKG